MYTEGSSDEENSKSFKPTLPNIRANKELKLPLRKPPKTEKKIKSLDIQSTSKNEQIPSGSIGDDYEYHADDEISWKVNRGSGALAQDSLSS